MKRFSKQARILSVLLLTGIVGLFYVAQFAMGRIDSALFILIGVLLVLTYVLLVTMVMGLKMRVDRPVRLSSAELSERIVRFARDAILIIDASGTIALVNPAAEQLFGYKKERILGQSLGMLMPEKQQKDYLKSFKAFAKNGRAGKTREVTAVRRGGEEFPAELSVSNVTIADANYMIAIMRDISDRKQLHEEQEHIEAQKQEFVSIVAHQLKDPIAAMRWQLEVLLDDRKGTQADKETLLLLEEITQNMNRLVTDLLQSSRIELGKIRTNIQKIDCLQLIQHVMVDFQNAADAGRVSVDSHGLKQVFLNADPNLFAQVIQNLVDNALKYSDETTTVEISVKEEGDRVIIAVTDHGIGIPADEKDHVFEKFYRATNARIRSVEGTGLGLHVVKQFVELFDGEISFESKEGVGTTFTITFPNAA